MPRCLESRFECNLCRVAQNQEQMLKSWMRESCPSLFRTVSESQTRWRKESHEQKYKMRRDRDTHTPQVKLSLLWQLLGNPNKQNRLTHPHTRHNLLEVITQLSKQWNMKLEVIAWKLISFDWVKINLGTNCCLVHSCRNWLTNNTQTYRQLVPDRNTSLFLWEREYVCSFKKIKITN